MAHLAIQWDSPSALLFVLVKRGTEPVTIRPVMSDEQRVEKEDRELVQRMASKDAAALDAFYQRYNRFAFSLILRIVGNREDSEDVLTDVFWQVWQQSGRYDSSRGKPAAWLLTIARTRAIDRFRSTGRQQMQTTHFDEHQEPSATPAEPDIFVLTETRQAVQEGLRSLSE